MWKKKDTKEKKTWKKKDAKKKRRNRKKTWKKKDKKEKRRERKKTQKKKKRITTHPHHPSPDQLRNYETSMPYGSLKMKLSSLRARIPSTKYWLPINCIWTTYQLPIIDPMLNENASILFSDQTQESWNWPLWIQRIENHSKNMWSGKRQWEQMSFLQLV